MKGWYSFEEIPQILLEKEHGLTFFLGGTDTGKTTLFKRVAESYLSAGLKVGLVDADIGQSTIGPPTTIGMLVASGGLPDLSQAQALYFVGDTRPVGHLMGTSVGSRLMVDKAVRAGVDVIVFDSTGLVQPPYGQVLKYRKLELLKPRFIVALEKGDELAPMISWLSRCRDSELIRVRPPAEVRSVSASERTRNRQEQYRRYFQDAAPRAFSLKEPSLYPPGFLSGETDPIGLLVGLQDESWNTVAIGIIESMDEETINIYTPDLPEVHVCGLFAGYIKLSRSGVEIARIRPRELL